MPYLTISLKMKAITLITLLVLSQIVFGSDTTLVEVSVRSVHDISKPLLSVTFDGKDLVIREKQQPALTVPLTPKDLSNLQKAVNGFNHEDWSGFWGRTSVLDGILLIGRLVNGEKNSEFMGANGCPPGFAGFAKSVDLALGRKVFGNGWEEMETEAEHYESFEHATKDALAKGENED